MGKSKPGKKEKQAARRARGSGKASTAEQDVADVEAVKEIEERLQDLTLEMRTTEASIRSCAIEAKRAELMVKELEPLGEDIKMYRQVGKTFLLQPYMLKPNGEVFDEVRNFFIDGQWRYSIFTHGTDASDGGYYEEPDGPRKEACKAMAERAYREILKAAKWQGKHQTPLLNRIDIGIVPDKSKRLGYRIFVNEIEPHMTTWLGRYCPFDIADKMGHACVKKLRQLLKLSLDARRAMPNAGNVRKLLEVLDERLGPLDA